MLVTIHMVAHHFVVEEIGGLRSYDDVIAYISTPVIFVIEGIFLVVVTIHAMLGPAVGALRPRARRSHDAGWSTEDCSALGIVTVAYGFVLIGVLASRG